MGTRESISSKNMTHGAEARARWNTVLTARSLSPTYMFSNSGPVRHRGVLISSIRVNQDQLGMKNLIRVKKLDYPNSN